MLVISRRLPVCIFVSANYLSRSWSPEDCTEPDRRHPFIIWFSSGVGGHVINEEGEHPADRLGTLLFLQQLFPNSAVIQNIIDVSLDLAQGVIPRHAQVDFQGHARPHR